ncbi:MAG TPA: LamG-like jellyroll fold domain-containing protein [Candidatus Nanoarchaeia archaeon]|nr:LamG-like jellyroll fold domain-containing protein [Candidatus Nanoarchaeia archaeon]
MNGCTFSAWAKGVKSGVPRIIGRWQSTGDDRFFLFGFSSTQQLSFIINPDGGPSVSCTANSAAGQFLNNTYQHVVGVYNLTNTAVYINGTLAGTTACSFNNISVSQWADEEDTRIGADAIGNQWNGTIDEVMIWNRSLSTEQIQALWQNKTNIIVAQETVRAEIWSVQITPNDGFDDGQMLQSNNVTILNIAPNITTLVLNSTNLTSNKTDVNLTAYATAFDSDGDSVKVIYNWFRNNSPISIINMPFEGINGTSSNNIWDYSSLGHNGSENGGGNWSATAGYDGKGAYQFDGQDDYLRINNSGHLKGTLCINGCTFSAWVYQGVNTQDQTIIGRWNTSNDDRFFLFRVGQGVTQAKTLAFEIGQDGGTTVCSGVDPAVESFLSNTWQHVVGRYNLTHTSVFINGTEQAAAACGSFSSITASAWEDAEDTLIGTESDGGPTQTWNGTIDEIMIFNRSLSLEQIQNLARNKTDVLVHQETASGEVWNVSVTPNDGFDDGQTLFSNSIRILDSTAPTVTITTPADGSNFSSGNQLFRAAVTDDESGVDSVRFMFNTNTTPFNATVSINGPSWDATVDMATITEGLHTVTAFANDTVGNVNQSVNITITVDRTPPNVSIFFVNDTSANNTNHTNSGVIQINATLNDTLTTVTHVRFGIFNPRNNSEFNLTTIKLGSFWTQDISLSTLTDAVYTIRVYGNDTLGNLNNSVSNLSFIVDTTPPNVSIFFTNDTATNNSNHTNSGVIQINVTLNDTLTTVTDVRFGIFNTVNNSEFNLTTIKLGSFWTQDLSLATLTDAVYFIRVYGNDTLGNMNNSVINLSFTVDATPPTVNITNPSNGVTLSGTQTFSATVRDATTVVNTVIFQFSAGTTAINRTASNTSGNWNVSIDTTILAEDSQTIITVFANDTLGNMNRTETITVTIDNVVAGGVTGGGGGGPSQGKPPKEAPEAAYLCGNGDLENGEECDAGDGCTAECTCSSGYMPKHEVDCELLPYCGDGEINGGEECDGADLDGKTCNSLEYAEGKLSCSSSCTLDSNECITYEEIYNKLLTEIEGILPESGSSLDIDQKFEQAKNLFEEKKFKEAYELLLELKGDLKVYQLLILPGKKIFSGIGKSVQEDTGYWLLSGMVGLLVLAGYYVKGLPIKEYVWKLKPVPEVRIKEPLTTPSSITAKPSKPLTLLGKKSYVDLQQQLEQVDKLLEEVPVPETTNAVKLTSLRNGSEIGTKKPIISIKNIEELEQWVDKMLLLKTPEAKMTEIIQKVTNFSNGEISIALQRVKATKLLQERYSINDKAVAELKKFISREFKKGASPQQIITDLVQEGWDMRTIKPYVIAYYN